MSAQHTPGPEAGDLLDMAYINSLPQPFIGRTLRGWEWPIHDIDVQTGLLRIDVMGKLSIQHITDFTSFRDDAGVVHPVDGFYVDALPEDRAAIAKATGSEP